MWYVCFAQIYFWFPKKLEKIVHDANRYKMEDIKEPSMNFAPKKCKSKFAFPLFVFLYGRYCQII